MVVYRHDKYYSTISELLSYYFNFNILDGVVRALPKKCKMTFGASRWDALKVDKFRRNFGSTD